MKKLLKKIGQIILVSFCVISFPVLVTNAAEVEPQRSSELFPLNSDPITGTTPPLPQKPTPSPRKGFEEKYDPRLSGKATPVRNQGQLGLCWAYSGTDVLATAAKVQLGLQKSYSPNYYNYLFAGNAFYDSNNPYAQYYGGVGGNSKGAKRARILDEGAGPLTLLLTSNLGKNPVLADDFSTPTSVNKNKSLSKDEFALIESRADKMNTTDVYLIPSYDSQTVTEDIKNDKLYKIKNYVKNYGALTYNIHTDWEFSKDYQVVKNQGSASQKTLSYVPFGALSKLPLDVNGHILINHSVNIIGWDDSIDRNSFKTPAQKNGAFLVKNSWGEDWGDQGYFYVSYDDIYLLSNELISAKVENKSSSEELHSYVNSAVKLWSFKGRPNTSIGSTFSTKDKVEKLTSYSFYSGQQGTKYEAYYVPYAMNLDHWDYFKGYQKIDSGTVTDTGYIRKKLTSPIDIPANQEYSILVNYVNSSEFSVFSVAAQEVNEKGGESTMALKGRTFYSQNYHDNQGQYWWPLQGNSTSGQGKVSLNLYLNAYTKVDNHYD